MKTPSVVHTLARVLALVLCSLAMNQAATAAEVAGIQYQSTTQLGSSRLQLNGAGLRQLESAALYAAGLYTEKKLHSALDVLNTTGATQLRLVMLRETSAKKLSEMLTQGLVSNSSDEALAPLISEIFGVGVMLSEQGKLLPGDTIQIDSQPKLGTTVTIRGTGRGMPVSQTFVKPQVFRAMMGIWLGENPADPALKRALLGAPI